MTTLSMLLRMESQGSCMDCPIMYCLRLLIAFPCRIIIMQRYGRKSQILTTNWPYWLKLHCQGRRVLMLKSSGQIHLATLVICRIPLKWFQVLVTGARVCLTWQSLKPHSWVKIIKRLHQFSRRARLRHRMAGRYFLHQAVEIWGLRSRSTVCPLLTHLRSNWGLILLLLAMGIFSMEFRPPSMGPFVVFVASIVMMVA